MFFCYQPDHIFGPWNTAASPGECLSIPVQQGPSNSSVLLSYSFLRHCDETKTLPSIPQFCLIGADGEHSRWCCVDPLRSPCILFTGSATLVIDRARTNHVTLWDMVHLHT